MVGESIEKKLDRLPKFRPACRNDLLIYDDTPVPAYSKEAFATMGDWVRSIGSRRGCAFARISVIKSLDVAYDLGGDFRVLPFLDWEAPAKDGSEASRDFAARAEYAGQFEAQEAIRLHVEAGDPIYFSDTAGRLVKQTADGRLFEVRVLEDGKEVVVEELLRE